MSGPYNPEWRQAAGLLVDDEVPAEAGSFLLVEESEEPFEEPLELDDDELDDSEDPEDPDERLSVR
ncbi:hypothetical protein [Sphaerisporangium fuscum]|uniref:hypothetical protein n=1 Tax=Sphaerisporangium fuscum TaxID=2835868 RepID=UPI0027E273B1|nr:hypothetical protein [Sphaerisporangium fuscum]